MLVDDYGHHPTEVDVTIQAARQGWEEACRDDFPTASLLTYA